NKSLIICPSCSKEYEIEMAVKLKKARAITEIAKDDEAKDVDEFMDDSIDLEISDDQDDDTVLEDTSDLEGSDTLPAVNKSTDDTTEDS
ncbi:MAG: FYDLN acid domain-containing protein, partial [Pseudomonadota bacterium]